MHKAGKIVAGTFKEIKSAVKAGINTAQLDRIAQEYIINSGALPAFKGYGGFPANICVSVNEQVIHGIPGDLLLKEGDIVGVDVGVVYDGYYSDAARTFFVGKVSTVAEHLVKTAEGAFFEAMKYAKTGYRLSDISSSIQEYVEMRGCSVVRNYVGHGIGMNMHEDPQVPNYGPPGKGARLRHGMTLAIEPMVNEGTDRVKVLDDGWTVVTEDGKLSAHYENTIAILDGEPLIFTLESSI